MRAELTTRAKGGFARVMNAAVGAFSEFLSRKDALAALAFIVLFKFTDAFSGTMTEQYDERSRATYNITITLFFLDFILMVFTLSSSFATVSACTAVYGDLFRTGIRPQGRRLLTGSTRRCRRWFAA